MGVNRRLPEDRHGTASLLWGAWVAQHGAAELDVACNKVMIPVTLSKCVCWFVIF